MTGMADSQPQATPPAQDAAKAGAQENPAAPAENQEGGGGHVDMLRARVSELGRQESERVAQLRQRQQDFAQRGELLLRDVPPRFFEMAAALRDAVARFNAALTEDDPGLPLRYEETPAVILRETGGDDLRVSVWRKFGRFDLTLRMMTRAGKPPVPLIEGHGSYGALHPRRVMVRIEGWVENGKTTFWYTLDFKRLRVSLDEVPDRIVLSVIQADPSILSRSFKEAEPPQA
jgi:hypothetical protein